MSYSIEEAKKERQHMIDVALMERDVEALFKLADSSQDEEEHAELHQIARKIERENWSYDERKDESVMDSYNN